MNKDIIGFNLNLNFMFTNDEEHKKIINKVENLIDDLFKDSDSIGTVLLGGKSEFIRNNDEKGIIKLNEESE